MKVSESEEVAGGRVVVVVGGIRSVVDKRRKGKGKRTGDRQTDGGALKQRRSSLLRGGINPGVAVAGDVSTLTLYYSLHSEREGRGEKAKREI